MNTLLEPGDRVSIRKDITDGEYYSMRSSFNEFDRIFDYVSEMKKPGEFVTIESIKDGTYRIIEDIYTYTDDMFDQELINYLDNNK